MIRVLVIGRGSEAWSRRLEGALGAAEVEAARLPAGGIRAFERSPADVVVFCGDVKQGRLEAVVATLRGQPLGAVLPFVSVADGELEDVDAYLSPDCSTEDLVAELLEAVGLDPGDLAQRPVPVKSPAVHSAPEAAGSHSSTGVTASDIERKQREVRHETYFRVLEVSADATPAEVTAAFANQWKRFEVGAIASDLEQQWDEALAEVRDGLEDAYAVLGNERLRAAYAEPRRRAES